MSENDKNNSSAVIELVSDVVAAYVSNNHIAASDLPALISTVYAAISGLGANGANAEQTASTDEKATPAEVRKSIRPDGLVSFIDGKSYKTLKRHLTKHGFTPASYCARFGLPSDYPVVAASYSEKRASLARSLGLGQLRGRAAQATETKPAVKGRKKVA